MSPRRFFVARAVVLSVLLAGVAIFFIYQEYWLNDEGKNNSGTTPEEVIDKNELPQFKWRFGEAETVNGDGQPETDIFLEKYWRRELLESRLVDTTPGSCNELPEVSPDSAPNSVNIQCYSAGLGYRYKIITGQNSYLVLRQMFEESTPEYEPPNRQYETIAEFEL